MKHLSKFLHWLDWWASGAPILTRADEILYRRALQNAETVGEGSDNYQFWKDWAEMHRQRIIEVDQRYKYHREKYANPAGS